MNEEKQVQNIDEQIAEADKAMENILKTLNYEPKGWERVKLLLTAWLPTSNKAKRELQEHMLGVSFGTLACQKQILLVVKHLEENSCSCGNKKKDMMFG